MQFPTTTNEPMPNETHDQERGWGMIDVAVAFVPASPPVRVSWAMVENSM